MVTTEQYKVLHAAIREKWQQGLSVNEAYSALQKEIFHSFSKKTVSRDYQKLNNNQNQMETDQENDTNDSDTDNSENDSDSDDENSEGEDDSDGDEQVQAQMYAKKLKQTKRMAVLLRLQATNMTATNKDIFDGLNNFFGPNFVSLTFVKKWAKQFRDGQTSTSSQPRCGRERKVSDDDFDRYLQNNQDATSDQIAEHFGITSQCVSLRLKKIGYRSRIRQWIPTDLTESQKENRVRVCTAQLEVIRTQPNFFDTLITMDEKYVTYENPFRQRYWYHPNRPVVIQTPQIRPYCEKLHLVVFWDRYGVIHYTLEPQNSRLTSHRFCKILDDVSTAINQNRPHLASNPSRIKLLMDNARAHSARETQVKLEELQWQVLEHPPYSPDIAPSDYHLFLSMSNALRGQKFCSKEEVCVFLLQFFEEKNNEGDFWLR